MRRERWGQMAERSHWGWGRGEGRGRAALSREERRVGQGPVSFQAVGPGPRVQAPRQEESRRVAMKGCEGGGMPDTWRAAGRGDETYHSLAHQHMPTGYQQCAGTELAAQRTRRTG